MSCGMEDLLEPIGYNFQNNFSLLIFFQNNKKQEILSKAFENS